MMIIEGLFGTTSATVFTIIITVMFILSALVLAIMPEKSGWVIARAPGLLTALGLFGTFWGVAEGLGGFNSRNIDASIPVLLEGLKLAFWTSILGMFYATLFNIVHYFTRIFADSDMPEDTLQKINSAAERLSGSIGIAAASLQASADTQAKHIEGVTRTLEALIRQAAKDSGGILNNEGAIQFRDFTQRIHELTGNLSASLEESAHALEAQKELLRQVQGVSNNLGGLAESIKASTDAQNTHITNITLELENVLKAGVQNVESEFNRTAEAVKRNVEETIGKLDSETERMLHNVLQVMADNLCSIHAKLIENLETITDRLQELSRTAQDTMRQDRHEQR